MVNCSAYDCTGKANALHLTPDQVVCASDACTDAECCTVPRATLRSVSISSSNTTNSVANDNDTITLTFTSSEALNASPTCVFQSGGSPVTGASVTTTDTSSNAGTGWSCTYTVVPGDTAGIISFTINATTVSNNPFSEVTSVTDNSSVTIERGTTTTATATTTTTATAANTSAGSSTQPSTTNTNSSDITKLEKNVRKLKKDVRVLKKKVRKLEKAGESWYEGWFDDDEDEDDEDSDDEDSDDNESFENENNSNNRHNIFFMIAIIIIIYFLVTNKKLKF